MVPVDPSEARERPPGLVLVHVASTSVEAYGLRARLEAEDIPVFMKGESEGPYRMAFTPIYLFVDARFEVQARLVVADALSGGLSLPEE